MKTIPILLVIFLTQFVFPSHTHAQATSPRRIVRNIVPPKEAPVTPSASPTAPPASPALPASTTKPTAKHATAASVVPKTEEEKAEILKKTVESQKKRAEEGSASAQYDLGVRYIKGDGVEKDIELARKWLELSAKQGNSAAASKLERLDKTNPAKIKTEPVKN